MNIFDMLSHYKQAYADAIAHSYEQLCVITKEANDSKVYESLMIEMIKHFESFEPTPQPDPLGIPTVGYGHVVTGGEPAYPWTKDQGATILLEELEKRYVPSAKAAWNSKPGKLWRVEEWDLLAPWVRAGIVSAVYNGGPAIITTCSWPQRATDDEAGSYFYKYSTGRDRSTGRRIRLAGLVRRRFCEWHLMTKAELDFEPLGWREWYNTHKL